MLTGVKCNQGSQPLVYQPAGKGIAEQVMSLAILVSLDQHLIGCGQVRGLPLGIGHGMIGAGVPDNVA